jgi:hypothetical protein
VRAHPGIGPLWIDAPAPSTDVAGQVAGQATILADAPGRFPRTQYVVVRPAWRRVIAVQYWFFYYADALPLTCIEATQTHEGDWEHVTVLLKRRPSGALVPLGVDFGWHSSSSTLAWGSTVRRGRHVVVYAASGSHASYPFPGEYRPPTRFGSDFINCVTDRTATSGSVPSRPREQLRWLRATTPGFDAGATRLLWGEEPLHVDSIVDEGPVTPLHQTPYLHPLRSAVLAAPLAELWPTAAICSTAGGLRLVRDGRVVLGDGGPATVAGGRAVRSLPWVAASAAGFAPDPTLPNDCQPPYGVRGVWAELLLSPELLASGSVETPTSPSLTARAVRDAQVICNPAVFPDTRPSRVDPARCVDPR